MNNLHNSNKYLKVITLFSIPVIKIFNTANFNYKINFCGIKFSYKTKELIKKANEYNKELNKKNLNLELPSGKNNHFLFIVSDLEAAGGVETRLLQYIQKFTAAGWRVSILCERNNNEQLLKFTNFHLMFNAPNVNECLNELIDKHNIKIIEFQFKNSKILKNINIAQLQKKVKIGCVIHNKGVKNRKIINTFDYKIMVSRYMYENFYKKDIKDAHIIQNSIDTKKFEDSPVWQYKNQKTALLISRISSDKVQSIECFIKYCQKNKIDFKIAGEEKPSNKIKNRLIKKFNLPNEVFIGKIDTMQYLRDNSNDILFTAGLGLVVLESLYLGYPCLCCSRYFGENYSFITKDNIELFDNFTIRRHSVVSKLKKKVYNLDMNNLSDYCLTDYVKEHRNLNKKFRMYLDICENVETPQIKSE